MPGARYCGNSFESPGIARGRTEAGGANSPIGNSGVGLGRSPGGDMGFNGLVSGGGENSEERGGGAGGTPNSAGRGNCNGGAAPPEGPEGSSGRAGAIGMSTLDGGAGGTPGDPEGGRDALADSIRGWSRKYWTGADSERNPAATTPPGAGPWGLRRMPGTVAATCTEPGSCMPGTATGAGTAITPNAGTKEEPVEVAVNAGLNTIAGPGAAAMGAINAGAVGVTGIMGCGWTATPGAIGMPGGTAIGPTAEGA